MCPIDGDDDRVDKFRGKFTSGRWKLLIEQKEERENGTEAAALWNTFSAHVFITTVTSAKGRNFFFGATFATYFTVQWLYNELRKGWRLSCLSPFFVHVE